MLLKSLFQLKILRNNQYLSPTAIRDLQEIKLRAVIWNAYENVQFYRKHFDAVGLKPGDIKDLDDLHKIPLTTKQDLQTAAPVELISKDVRINQCVVKQTSGSTGLPLKIYLKPAERDFQILLNLRILAANGLRITDRVAYVINPHRFPKSKYWFQYLGVLQREYLSVFDYPQKHSTILQALRPDVVYGYPSNLSLLALYMKEKHIQGINPRSVFSVAEALEPRAKKLIDSTMNVDTCDILGTIELGDIAWQCEMRNGYHISSDAVIVEFLNNGKPVKVGQEGKIVCTSLYSYTMPFIRYAVDDICVPSDRICKCGRTLPMIENIKGRANDFIVLPDGQIIASCFLVIIMQAFHDIAQYRIIQQDQKEIRVQITKGRGFSSSNLRRIENEIRNVTQNSLCVKIDIVDEIPRDDSGKIRTVVSELIPNLQGRLDQQASLWIG